MRLTGGTSCAVGERREGAAAWALRATVPRWAALVGWSNCAAREGTGGGSVMKAGRADARAGGKLGHAGCGPARQHGAAVEWAVAGQGRPGRGRKKAGLAGVGPVGEFFPNQIFIKFYFLHFHF